MFADPDKNKARRLRRQLKAGVSIVVALAAGAFLTACGSEGSPTPSPSGPDSRGGPSPSGSGAAPKGSGAASSTPSAAPSTPPSAAPSASAIASATPSASSSAIVPVTPSAGPRVDKNEHRKGMPVPDNLLE